MSLAAIVDVGTTSVKVGIVDAMGNIIAQKFKDTPASRPERGAYEHDPDVLLGNISELMREMAEPYRDSIAFLGLSGYQFGLLPLDSKGLPLTGMITLLDDRSKSVMGKVRSEFALEDIYRKTGCPALFTYTLSRIVWLKQEKPEIFKATKRFADLKSFLLEKWIGRFITEPSIAAATQLLNIHTSDWDDQILGLVQIDRSYLPEVVPGSEFAGGLITEAAEMLGLNPGTPVLPGLYDGGSLILGMGGCKEKIAVCNLGTTTMLRGCAKSPLIDDPRKMRLQTYAFLPGYWVIGGALNNAGVALRWFRDTFGPTVTFESLLAEAERIKPGAEGLFCLPFLTGERDPRIGDLASGAFFGIKEFHTRAHFARSILEGVAYGLNMVKEAAAENDFNPEVLRIGGSGAESDLWAAILADVLNIEVEKADTPGAALVGVSILGFTALGTYDSIENASGNMIRTGKRFSPSPDSVAGYTKRYRFFTQLVESFHDLYQAHSSL